ATSEWIQFFREAGIPPGPAVNYAVTFVDNRIRKNMLLDLTKEIMNELGITVVGDIIAILKHAKTAYRQEMCKAATESLCPKSPGVQAELRRNATSAAGRMIANSLSGDSLPAAPLRPRGRASKLSVTVSNKAAEAGLRDAAEENPAIPLKRRRVTAEMEGKYVITMPKGTTPRTRKILEQQAARGLQRTSVFDRLGAEAIASPTPGGKPSGVFSRLGEASDGAAGSDDDGSVLQYAGVLKQLPKALRKERSEAKGIIKAKATSSEAKPSASRRLLAPRDATAVHPTVSEPGGADAEGAAVTKKEKSQPEFRVTLKRTWGCGKVSSTSEIPTAQMDTAGSRSVFQRLGRK
ncbi:Uncharacterized protein C19orf47, partial [Cuculus canorus]